MALKDLYDLDFFEWTQQNAELLRKRCLSEIDVATWQKKWRAGGTNMRWKVI
jgi:hypothetical protein